MGTVWLCRDETLGRQVAIKQMGSLSGESAAETTRAMREARLTAGLTHPNAVAVHDVVVHDGRPWLVMEYVDGQTLADEMQRDGRLSPERVADIGAQLASALAQAHERRIVHRDIKPANVLIDRAGRAKISDFGIARGHGDERLTATGVFTGTPGFLSPELARGGDASPASDVWALGATLYTAVEGRQPYDSRSNHLALLQAISTGPPRPMTHAGALGPVINAMMHVDPDCRWDMLTCAERLAGIVGGDATAFGPLLEAPDTATQTMAEPALEPTRHMGPAEALSENQRSERRWLPLTLVALLAALLVVALPWTYLVTREHKGSNVKTFTCSAGGFKGYIQFSDTSNSIVSYKIDPGSNSGGNSADVSVIDGGVTPPRAYRTSEGKEDAAYHALEGPYARSGGGLSFTFIFDKNHRNDPSCSGNHYLAG
jgi:serine/threonine protein kinase